MDFTFSLLLATIDSVLIYNDLHINHDCRDDDNLLDFRPCKAAFENYF